MRRPSTDLAIMLFGVLLLVGGGGLSLIEPAVGGIVATFGFVLTLLGYLTRRMTGAIDIKGPGMSISGNLDQLPRETRREAQGSEEAGTLRIEPPTLVNEENPEIEPLPYKWLEGLNAPSSTQISISGEPLKQLLEISQATGRTQTELVAMGVSLLQLSSTAGQLLLVESSTGRTYKIDLGLGRQTD